MFLSKTLLSLFLVGLTLADTTSAGKASLSFSTRINQDGKLSIVEKDRVRAKSLQNAGHGKRSTYHSYNITNAGALTYTAQIGVGSPVTWYTLLIEAASSITWVGAEKPYSPTSTSKDTGNTMSVSYGAFTLTGKVWLDTITIGTGLSVNEQAIGVANPGFSGLGVDGYLGLGPTALTTETVTNMATVPTIMDNLVSQGKISQDIFSIYFTPATKSTSPGEITFGGYDNTVNTSAVNYVPLTKTSPASEFWGIDQSVSYGDTTILPMTAGSIDPGSTLVFLATDAYNTYKNLTESAYDEATHLLTISTSRYSALRTLSFHIGGHTYDLSPNAQIWPRSLNSAVGGSSHKIYLVVADLGTPSGKGYDFILGYAFLERYYAIFDRSSNPPRFGLATTVYTHANTN